jgi:hypothetical protein
MLFEERVFEILLNNKPFEKSEMKITVFWDMATCSMADIQ